MNQVIIYKPRLWTKPLHESNKRWKVIVVHRRGGKTTACINHLVRDAMMIEKSKYAYIAPTYKLAKNVAWDILKEVTRQIDGTDFNEAELRVNFKNGSRITLYGADNPDALRGMALWGVVFDEYSQQPSNIFTEIIRPALADHQGYAIWIGTPKGRNEFYRLYQRALTDKDWLGMLLTVNDTKVLPESEVEDAKKGMSFDEFNQEFMCSFDASIKGAIYAKEISEAQNRIKEVPYDKALKVHTVWDLGVGDAMAIGFYQKVGNELRKIDYYEKADNEGLPHFIKILQNKPYIYGKHFAPHDIKVRELTSGKSRLEIAENLGIKFDIIPSTSLEAGIERAKLTFSHLWVDREKCQVWLDNIARYKRKWLEDKGMFSDKPDHDFTSHSADEYRYASLVENEMSEINTYQQAPYQPTEYEGGVSNNQDYIITQTPTGGKVNLNTDYQQALIENYD